MAGMTEAMKFHKWPEELRHAPISAEPVDGGRFQCACRCGYAGKAVTSSPSHAFQATRVHAENENRREEGGGEVVQPEDYTRTGEPPKAKRTRAVADVSLPGDGSSRPARAPRSRSQGTPGTPCGCGCGEPSGGLFRPGHDSKLLSRLLGEIRANTKTLAEAHLEMVEIGTSEVLREKLAKKVSA